MKVVITVQDGKDLSAPLDPRFGRCGAFLVVDSEKGEVIEAIPNREREASHGAGVGAAALVAGTGAEAVISGRFGPKASLSLRAKGIRMYAAPDGVTAGDALTQFREGELREEELREFR